jgi:cytochrome c oxidase cbb3-type subunit III
MRLRIGAIITSLLLAGGCSSEQRALTAPQPTSAPTGPDDPRIAAIKDNFYQISQGGRYFIWYGCTDCHGEPKAGWPPRLSFVTYYARIGHKGYDRRIAAEQRWQISAYLNSLPATDPAKRHRQAVDQKGEPITKQWQGPL